MYFQFLIEDQSAGILVDHVLKKLKDLHSENEIFWNIKTFKGIGNLSKKGSALDRKTGKLLNDLPLYMRGIDKGLSEINATIVVVLDNDNRDKTQFKRDLEKIVSENMILSDHIFAIAVKELEAWILGDTAAIMQAYPNAKLQHLKRYEQDGICDTWEVLADIVYPHGLSELKKKAGGGYAEIGKAKCEWADRIGEEMSLHQNNSPSYKFFISELERRILA